MIDTSAFNKKVAVIGLGYVGLPMSKRLVDCGYQVVGIDTDAAKVKLIKKRKSPIEDITNDDLGTMFDSGHFSVSTEFSSVRSVKTILVCVPTPLDDFGLPDYNFLDSAISSITEFISPDTLIVNESTSSPGTLRNRVASKILDIRVDLLGHIFFAVAPERINPGDSKFPIGSIPRVVGGLDYESLKRAHAFYASFNKVVHLVSSPEIAEFSKLLENTYRQLNIAFINQFNHFCRLYGVDTREVIEAASTKPYGFQAFYPSAGIGGHCIPVDPQYLYESAKEIGCELTLIAEATRINKKMPELILERVKLFEPDFATKSFLVMGLGYKPGLSDLRESSGVHLIKHLENLNLAVDWYDSHHKEWNGTKRWNQVKKIDIAILCILDDEFLMEELINSGAKVFDCTGEMKNWDGVLQI